MADFHAKAEKELNRRLDEIEQDVFDKMLKAPLFGPSIDLTSYYQSLGKYIKTKPMKTTEQKIAELEEKFNRELNELKKELKPKELTLQQIVNNWTTDTYQLVVGSPNSIQKLNAIRDMIAVADYLNGDWKPDWDANDDKFYINHKYETFIVIAAMLQRSSFCYFRTKELAQKAISILGEERIKLALS